MQLKKRSSVHKEKLNIRQAFPTGAVEEGEKKTTIRLLFTRITAVIEGFSRNPIQTTGAWGRRLRIEPAMTAIALRASAQVLQSRISPCLGVE